MKIINGKITHIPDIHQNLKFASEVLEKESDSDYFIFHGDYFDCSKQPDNVTYFSIKKNVRVVKRN